MCYEIRDDQVTYSPIATIHGAYNSIPSQEKEIAGICYLTMWQMIKIHRKAVEPFTQAAQP